MNGSSSLRPSRSSACARASSPAESTSRPARRRAWRSGDPAEPRAGALGERERRLRVAVDELGAALDRHPEHRVRPGIDAPAEPVAGLDEHHGAPEAAQLRGRREARRASADDDHARDARPIARRAPDDRSHVFPLVSVSLPRLDRAGTPTMAGGGRTRRRSAPRERGRPRAAEPARGRVSRLADGSRLLRRRLRRVLHELDVELERDLVADGGARLDELVPGEPELLAADPRLASERAARLAEHPLHLR